MESYWYFVGVRYHLRPYNYDIKMDNLFFGYVY